MKRKLTIALLTTLLALGPLTAWAGYEYEKIADGYFVVSYELGKWTRGGILDTQGRVDAKLIKNTRKLCRESNYQYHRFLLLEEVARDEDLRTAWLRRSEQLADESGWDKWVESLYGIGTHSAKKVVFFAPAQGDGLETCAK